MYWDDWANYNPLNVQGYEPPSPPNPDPRHVYITFIMYISSISLFGLPCSDASKCDPTDDFMVFHRYDDATTLALIGAVTTVLGEAEFHIGLQTWALIE